MEVGALSLLLIFHPDGSQWATPSISTSRLHSRGRSLSSPNSLQVTLIRIRSVSRSESWLRPHISEHKVLSHGKVPGFYRVLFRVEARSERFNSASARNGIGSANACIQIHPLQLGHRKERKELCCNHEHKPSWQTSSASVDGHRSHYRRTSSIRLV